MRTPQLHLITAFVLTVLTLPAQAQWVAKGRDAVYNMYLPQAKKPDTNALIIVSYDKRWACRPSVSVMMISGKQLGAPERQATMKKVEDQLLIIVDGKRFTEATKLTMYSNGLEMAMFAPPGLVEALNSNPKSVVAKVGEKLGGFDFSDGTGFASANAAAKNSCS